MIELSIYYLIAVITVLFIILFIFMLYIFYQRERESRFNKVRDTYLKNNSQLWFEYLVNDEDFSVVLVPRKKAQVEAIEIIFLSYLKNIINEDIKLKIKEFSNLYLKKFYEMDLRSKRWSIKMNVLYHIADFHINELLEACQQLEQTNISKEEHFQLLKIYSLLKTNLFIEKISLDNSGYSESSYRRLFILLEDDVFIRFFDEFDRWSTNIQFAVIDSAAAKKNLKYVDRLKQLLMHEKAEIKIRALKGLFEIGIIDDIKPYIPFVTSDMWEIRLMVVKIFKHVPLSYTYPYLKQLMSDENWWVRTQAVKTIAEERDGLEKLQQFISSSSDQYAIEMAQEIVNRKEGDR